MPASLPHVQYEDGSQFIANERVQPDDHTPFCDVEQNADGSWKCTPWENEQIVDFAGEIWRQLYEGKRAEIERLKQNSLYFDGFHYQNPWTNRNNAVTNRIYQFVEAQVANLVMSTPRPEIVMRGGGPDDLAERLELFAEFIEDTNNYDEAIYLGARDKCIYGYNHWLISFDYESGMPFVRPLSVFHFYTDPAGRNEDEWAYCAIGMPVSTPRLRAFYPGIDIEPDNVASPEYGVSEVPWLGYMELMTWQGITTTDNVLNIRPEGENATTGVKLTLNTGYYRAFGKSTFLVQVFVRDEALHDVEYRGDLMTGDGNTHEGQSVWMSEPRCPSGWWKITITAMGQLLCPPEKVDECFLGLPIVTDRLQARTDRFYSMSGVDQAVPIQRGLNRRKRLLMYQLELAANPPVVIQQGGFIDGDRSAVTAGEVLKITRGSDLKYMEYGGPNAQQFNMLAADASDMQNVVGVPDVQLGIKPGGVEAASAIRELDQNSTRRLAGAAGPAHRARALLLKKLMYCAGKKLQPEIVFQASDGQTVSVTSEELCSQYHVRFAEKSGTPEGKQELEDKAILLGKMGYLDQPEVLKVFDWRNRQAIVARTQAQQQAQLEAALASKKQEQTQGAA